MGGQREAERPVGDGDDNPDEKLAVEQVKSGQIEIGFGDRSDNRVH